MKKLSLFIILAACASLLLSSCSHLKDISISKRHYRSGFYVDFGSAKPSATKSHGNETEKPVIPPSASNYAENESIVSPETTIPSSQPVITAVLAEKKKHAHKHAVGNTYASTVDASIIIQDMQVQALTNYVVSMPEATAPKSTSGSTPMWLIILLAIIIPPVGVALKFGITDKFWISLLLTLILWLPGAIYSVIVVTHK